MAKSNFVQNKFVSGELSENIKARTDLEQYYQGMEIATNVVTTPQGGVKRRMGSEFIDVPQGKTVRITGSFTFSSSNVKSGSNVNNLADNDPSTNAEFDGIGSNANVVIWQNTFSSNPTFTKTVSFIDLIGIKFSLDVSSTEFLLESSTDGSTWGADGTNEQSIAVPKITNFEQNMRLRVDIPVSTTGGPDTYVRRYWRLVRRASTPLGLADMSIQDVNFYELDTANISEDYKLHKFEVSKNDSFLLFFQPSNLRIFRVTDTATTYLQDINHGLGTNYPNRVASNENVLLLFNKDVSPRRLVYDYNNDGLFYYDTPTFTNIPRYDFDDRNSPAKVDAVVSVTFHNNYSAGNKYQLEINGTISKEIVYHGDANADEQSATASSMQLNLQEMPVFGDAGITVARTGTDEYTITMSGESANNYDQMTGFPTSGTTSALTFGDYIRGNDGKEAIWSSTRGYPNLGVFAQGRLWIGGTRDKPQVLLASEAGNYFDFLVDKGEANEGFLFTINGSKSAIVDVTGGRGVTVFTEGAEYSITGNTPATLDAQQQTQHGSFSKDVPTLALDGTTLFVDRNGRTLRQFIFDYREEGFRSVDMSVLSSHLINSPVDMDAVTAVSADDANYVFVINADGTAVVMNTLRDQDITGFTKFDQVRVAVDGSEIQGSNTDFAGTVDKYKQVVAVNNVLHVLCQTGGSVTSGYEFTLSRLTLDRLMDMSVKFEPSSSPDANGYYHPQYLTGTKHLSGFQLINVVAGNSVLPPRYAAQYANVVELTNAERELNATIEVGRNFVPTVKPMPLSTMMANGDNIQMALKRVDRMNLRVINSAGVNIDGIAVPVREFGDSGSSPLNTSLVPSTGIIEDNNGGNGWGREVVAKITVPDPTPFHLLAIDYEISS